MLEPLVTGAFNGRVDLRELEQMLRCAEMVATWSFQLEIARLFKSISALERTNISVKPHRQWLKSHVGSCEIQPTAGS